MARIRVLELVGNGEGGGTACMACLIRNCDPARFSFTVVAPFAPWLAEICAQRGATYHPVPFQDSRFDAKITATLAAIIQEAKPDIINAHGTRAAWFMLRALSQYVPQPAIVYSEHLFSFDARTGLMRLPWMAVERHICRRSNALTTSCEANAHLVELRGWVRPDQIATRHYGIELDHVREQIAQAIPRQQWGIPAEAPLIGTVSRLVPQKGMRYWLAAAARIVKDISNAQFLIIGDGELRRALEQQALRLGIRERVYFLGAHDKPWRILAACDIVAFSSLYEGLPQTALEALSAGIPTVTTRLPGTEEIIRSGWNGLLVPPRDAGSLAEAIIRLIRNAADCTRMRAVAPGSIAEYNITIMMERFRTLYERLYAQRQCSDRQPDPLPTIASISDAGAHTAMR